LKANTFSRLNFQCPGTCAKYDTPTIFIPGICRLFDSFPLQKRQLLSTIKKPRRPRPHSRIPAQQISKPLFPVTAGIGDVREAREHRQNVIDSVGVAAIQGFDNSGGSMQRKTQGDGELAVPEAGMMGAVISNNGQMMKKGRQIISSRS